MSRVLGAPQLHNVCSGRVRHTQGLGWARAQSLLPSVPVAHLGGTMGVHPGPWLLLLSSPVAPEVQSSVESPLIAGSLKHCALAVCVPVPVRVALALPVKGMPRQGAAWPLSLEGTLQQTAASLEDMVRRPCAPVAAILL